MTAPSSASSLLAEFSSPSLSPSLLQSLLHRLLSHPAIHNGFVDVLGLNSVQAALTNNPQRDVIVRTLELFGCGTVQQYFESTESFMALNDVQLEKLRMLSVISVAGQRIADHSAMRGGNESVNDSSSSMALDSKQSAASSRQRKSRRGKSKNNVSSSSLLSIPYSELAQKLHLPADNVRQLEDLLIQCIYANLIVAKLDQCSKCLVIEPNGSIVRDDDKINNNCSHEIHGSVLTRDLPSSPLVLPQMISQLETFLNHSNSLLAALESCALANVEIRKNESIRWKEFNRILLEGNVGNSSKFGASLDNNRGENVMSTPAAGGGERDRREVKRSKMQAAMMQRFS